MFFLGAMMETSSEKHVQSSRTGRQFRPILGGIIFLLATNLIAKGVLGLSAYTPPVAQNLQGSVYLNFGRPNQPTHQQQVLPYTPEPFPYPYTFWNPVPFPSSEATTSKPAQPIHQHQIININDPTAQFEEIAEEEFPQLNNQHTQHIVIEKQVIQDITPDTNIEHFPVPKREVKEKIKNHTKTFIHIKRNTDKILNFIGGYDVDENVIPATDLFRFAPKHHRFINKLANIKRKINTEENAHILEKERTTTEMFTTETTLPQDVEVFTVTDKEEDIEMSTIARQMQATTPTTTTTITTTTQAPTTTPTTTLSTAAPTTAAAAATLVTVTTPLAANNMTGNNTGYNYTVEGYGPYTGNENVSLTTLPPNMNATTMIVTTEPSGNTTENATTTGYYYYPAGEYGPSNGNENISITYGPPESNGYPKPFYSSPEDHYLNSQQRRQEYDYGNYGDNNNYPNFYGQNNNNFDGYNQFPQQAYNDVIQKFYNKFDYHYPSYFNNYVGK